MAEQRTQKPLVKLTGMYENTSQRTGDVYFAGYLGNAKIMLFRDKNAEPGKPTWSLCLQEKDPKPDQGGGYGQQAQQPPPPPQQGYGHGGGQAYGSQASSQPAPQSNHPDDDIPF